MDKLKLNPWCLVFAALGLAIIGALGELIAVTRDKKNVYVLWDDIFGHKAIEGEFVRAPDCPVDGDGEGGGIVNVAGDTENMTGGAPLVDTPIIQTVTRGSKGRFQRKETSTMD